MPLFCKGIKRIILVSAILFVSCASNPKGEGIAYSSSAINELASDHTSVITSEIFDVLQRPLGFNLSSQFKPISRISWEYHMAGIGWWDIYFMSGKKLGNGIYEKLQDINTNCETIELHSVDTQRNLVNMVEIVFVSSDKAYLENLRNQFNTVAIELLGSHGNVSSDGSVNWTSGWVHYTSYSIQYHESGKWIYLVGSVDVSKSY